MKARFLLMISSALVTGCSDSGGGSGGGSGTDSPSLNGTVYQRTTTLNTNWSGNGNWEVAQFIDGALQSSSSTPYLNPASGSQVILGNETIYVTNLDVNLRTLCIHQTTFNINNGAGNNFEVGRLEMSGGLVDIQAGTFTIENITFNGGIIRTTGGNIVLTPGKKVSMNDGTFDADITIPSGTEFEGHGSVRRNLINRGTLTLTLGERLRVGGYFNNTGLIKVYLKNEASSTTEILNVTGNIHLGGTLQVYGGVAGERYTLFKGRSITGGFTTPVNNVTLANRHPSYIITLNSVVPVPSVSTSIASPMFGHALSMGASSSGLYLSALQTGMDLMPRADKFSVNSDVTMTMNTQNNEKFFALNTSHKNGSFGLYLGYADMEKMDFGAYDIRAFGGFKLTNLVHMGKNEALTLNSDLASQVKTSFFQVKSELSHAFKLSGLTFSPKVSASYGKLIDVSGALKTDGDSFHMKATGKGLMEAGLGFDVASKFNVQEVPVEAFASLNVSYANGDNLTLVREGDGKRVQNEAGIKSSLALGFKANIDPQTNVYGNMNLSSMDDNSIEFGLKFKL